MCKPRQAGKNIRPKRSFHSRVTAILEDVVPKLLSKCDQLLSLPSGKQRAKWVKPATAALQSLLAEHSQTYDIIQRFVFERPGWAKGGNCERVKEWEAFVCTFLTVGLGNNQMLSIKSEGQRIGCPIYAAKRSRGGGWAACGAYSEHNVIQHNFQIMRINQTIGDITDGKFSLKTKVLNITYRMREGVRMVRKWWRNDTSTAADLFT